MPPSAAYRPDPQFPALGSEFCDPVRAADFPETILRFRNDRAAATVGLDGLTDAEWIAHFGRFRPLPGNIDPPVAQRYHGHQFRTYNPDLGDGRGFLFAQLREAGSGRLLDLGTKGSGQTPWSRGGDGRLTLKGGVREVLATAMLEALGVPTSRSFSLIETGEALVRGDEPSPTRSAVLVRLSHSHVRFGSFQRHAFFEAKDRVAALVDHVTRLYYPDLEGQNDRPAALLAAVVGKAARLTARWMSAGFVHGVLNTDNMNITGESFDYGPYRFLPYSDPNFVAAYFDSAGLYSFGRQPEAVFWNLQQLAGCLSLVTGSDPLVDALNGFGPAYRAELMAAMLVRLGVRPKSAEEDAELVQASFQGMAEGGERLRWEPFFFDWFCGSADRAMAGPRADLYAEDAFAGFRERLAAYAPERPERLAHAYFAQAEPEELLYDQIEALWAFIAEADDWTAFHEKLARIETARIAYSL
ncbi:protein adenylyltransferase SelO [Phenylobacterium sp.]|uniref:protein adenylyltransferase SelO n=1 Tax=Phenylobacterium sp. TaxID=1871053 RepID=UPI0025EDC7B9|nr:YdiU family protein [Phenylobacterium sp.]MBX3483367.1 YdiU family protein [Phenylobacterium sp.]